MTETETRTEEARAAAELHDVLADLVARWQEGAKLRRAVARDYDADALALTGVDLPEELAALHHATSEASRCRGQALTTEACARDLAAVLADAAQLATMLDPPAWPPSCVHCGAPAPRYHHAAECILRTELDAEHSNEDR